MLGIQQRSRVLFISLDIPATIGPGFWISVSLCIDNDLAIVFSNETVVTLMHSSMSAMVRNNVRNAFHSNLLFLS